MSEKVLGFKVKEKENKDYALCEVEKIAVCPHSEIGHNLEDLRYNKHECSDGTYETWDCPECSFSTEEYEEHLAYGYYREEFNRIPKYERVSVVLKSDFDKFSKITSFEYKKSEREHKKEIKHLQNQISFWVDRETKKKESISLNWLEKYVNHIKGCFEKNQPSDFEAGEETGRIEGLEVLLAEAKKEANQGGEKK